MSGMITEHSHVADIVAKYPTTSRVFEKYHIDFCCGGAEPLESICQEKGVQVSQVLQDLAALEYQQEQQQAKSWADQDNVDDIVFYILETFHAPLKIELIQLEKLMAKVAKVHGDKHPELKMMETTFANLREELMTHMFKEERILFPLMKSIYSAWRDGALSVDNHHCGSVQNPIRQMEHEHDSAGQALASLRSLSSDYSVPDDGCNSYRALYERLNQMEKDLHLHIHLENHVLHPLTARMESEVNTRSNARP